MIPSSGFWRISKDSQPQSWLALLMSDFLTMPDQPAPTVYFDGACPLCRTEIALYRRQAGAEALCFADVSNPTTPLGEDLDRHRAMRRFHVRKEDGSLVSGAAAFVELWKRLPRWRWAARAASMPGMLIVMEMAYRLFLTARPYLTRLFATLSLNPKREGPKNGRNGIRTYS
jgi:predicted DCC family thiol-disulfide oxidoreductase YuxK